MNMQRFYREVGVSDEGDGSYGVRLDGKPVRTPGRNLLVAPTAALARAVADEWDAQGKDIDPRRMPLTRTLNSAIDRVASERSAVEAHLAEYAGCDLLCYRASSPDELVSRQRAAWDPLVAWAQEELGLRLAVTEGVMPLEQPRGTEKTARGILGDFDAYALAAVNTVITVTGSFVIGIAVARGRLAAREAFETSMIDQDWQAEQWGRDRDAQALREHHRAEMTAAARMLDLLRDGSS